MFPISSLAKAMSEAPTLFTLLTMVPRAISVRARSCKRWARRKTPSESTCTACVMSPPEATTQRYSIRSIDLSIKDTANGVKSSSVKSTTNSQRVAPRQKPSIRCLLSPWNLPG